ncbi:MAG: hypothetical protein ACYCQI_14455 [Gammaproteobacteria bacterium]
MTAGRYSQDKFIDKFKDRLKDLDTPRHLSPEMTESITDERAISGTEAIQAFRPDQELKMDELAKVIADSSKRSLENKEPEGYCFGFFAMLCLQILKYEDPKKNIFDVVRTYINCPPELLKDLDETLKQLLIPLEWTQNIKYYTEHLEEDKRLDHLNIEEIFKEFNLNVKVKRKPRDYSSAAFAIILQAMGENEVMGINNTARDTDTFPFHIISLYRKGDTIFVHDPNYEDFESKPFSIDQPDLIFAEIKARLYDFFNAKLPDESLLPLHVRVIHRDVNDFVDKIIKGDIKLDIKNIEHARRLDESYLCLPQDQFVNFMKFIIEGGLIADDHEVEKLLNNKRWKDYSLLHLAAITNEFDAFKFFLENGATIEALGKNSHLVLTQALGSMDDEIIKLLFAKKPDLLHQKDEKGVTLLDYAKKSLSAEVFQDLTQRLVKGNYLVVKSTPAPILTNGIRSTLFRPAVVATPSPQLNQTITPSEPDQTRTPSGEFKGPPR